MGADGASGRVGATGLNGKWAGWAVAAFALLAGGPSTARAEEGPQGPPPGDAIPPGAPAATGDLADRLAPPELLADSPARWPEGLDGNATHGEVKLRILIDREGRVAGAEVTEPLHPRLDAAALEAARGLAFRPATLDGAPVEVLVAFSYRFEPPLAAPPTPAASARKGVLKGLLRSKGTRAPLPGAHVAVGEETAIADGEGRFSIEVPEGDQAVEVAAAGFRAGSFREEIVGGEELEVIYSLEPFRLNPYETVVRGERDRTEVARVSLHGQEVREVPGTMGDPFRVVMLMPGVSSMVSGVAYPVVRGSAPAATGYYLDGIRVPLLFHLFLGPAVIHPDFMESIDFFPGAPPPRFGRLLGGVIDGKVSSPGEEIRATAYADIINTGGYVQVPFEETGTNVTLAGRYSYTPWLLALTANAWQDSQPNGEKAADYVLDFWDYQGRVEQEVGPGKLRLFAFGSSDVAGTGSDDLKVSAASQGVRFHRADLRWQGPAAGGKLEAGATWGLDALQFDAQGPARGKTVLAIKERTLMARARWSGEVGERLTLETGADFERRQAITSAGANLSPDTAAVLTVDEPLALGSFAGAWAQLIWKSASEAWTLVPGLRLDNYHLVPGINWIALEPRLTVRRQLGERLALKGGAGLFHQQPTTLIQLPVVDLSSLRYGLQRGVQLDVGAEWKAVDGLEVRADGFFNPLLRTFELNPFDPEVLQAAAPAFDATTVPNLDSLLQPDRVASRGYTYGLELMLRHPLGGNWFGWVSYTLQRSVRWTRFTLFDAYGAPSGKAEGWLPYVFDQTHVVNAVLNYRLGSWTLGAAAHFNTGRPEAGVMTSNTFREGVDTEGRQTWNRVGRSQADRLPPYFRLDLRVARSWAFDDFMLDAYLDFMNATVSTEVVAFSYRGGIYGGGGALTKRAEGVPVVLPVLGVKGTY